MFPSPFARQDVVMPSQKKYPVTLAAEDREALERVTRTGVHPASVIRRARLLLALDTVVGAGEDRVVVAVQIGVSCEMVRLATTPLGETGGCVRATGGRKKRASPPLLHEVT